MSSLSDAKGRLRDAWGLLHHQWVATRDTWQDDVAADFERVHWAQIEEALPRVLAALEELEGAIATANRYAD